MSESSVALQLELSQQAILGLTREAGGLWFVYLLVGKYNKITQYLRQLSLSGLYWWAYQQQPYCMRV